jgi:transglutaminase-like putative cysteine protease
MQLQVTHETRYDYLPAVEVAQHMSHLQPLGTATQTLLSHALQITPEPVQQIRATDIYGNTRCFFSLQAAHSRLQVVAHSRVATRVRSLPASTVAWEQVRERFRFAAGSGYDAAAEFVFASPYVPRHADFAAYARPSFAAGTSVRQGACDLMRRIHTDFTYESESTEVNTPALQALAQRKGVCQDFAHIMIACLRALGLSARYVSGYLLTEPPPGVARLIGSDASHAWVSVYIPDFPAGDRWCDFDPTNDKVGWGAPGEGYITLAIGRDFGDVSPLRGVIHGGTKHTLHVGVTVAPVEEAEAEAETDSTQVDAANEAQPDITWQNGGQSQSQSQGPGQSQSQSQSQSQN